MMNSREIAARIGGSHHGTEVRVDDLATLEDAGPTQLAYAERKPGGNAGVLLYTEPLPDRCTVVVKDPKHAFITLLAEWYPEQHPAGIHRTAVIDGDVGEGVIVGAHAVVEEGAVLGDGVVVYAGAYIGRDCVIGEGTVIFPRVVLYRGTRVGARCRIHAGAVLGADGFSYHPTESGPMKVPQVGTVTLGDDVEIGANTCVDRAFLGTTEIGSGSAMDNLVQIGHNSRLGRQCLIAAQVGVSGSSRFGNGVVVGGQAGFADHVEVGDGAMFGAQSGVHGRVAGGRAYLGTPHLPARQAVKVMTALRDLPEIRRLVYRMARRLGLMDGL